MWRTYAAGGGPSAARQVPLPRLVHAPYSSSNNAVVVVAVVAVVGGVVVVVVDEAVVGGMHGNSPTYVAKLSKSSSSANFSTYK